MSSVEELSIKGLGQQLQTVFSVNAFECTTEDRVHLAVRKAKQEGETTVKYPILAYSISNFGPVTWQNPTNAALRPFTTSTGSDFVKSLRLYPTTFTFDITYLDDSRTRLIRFLSAWERASAEGKLNFRLLIDGMPVDIQVKPDPNLSVPKRDVMIESTSQYEFTGQMAMTTYLSGEFKENLKQIARIKETTIGFIAVVDTDIPVQIRGAPGPIPSPEEIERSLFDYDEKLRSDNLLYEIVITPQGVTVK